MPSRADVIIITALKEEYDAVLKVDSGTCDGSMWETPPEHQGQAVSFRSFQNSQGGQLRVAVVRASGMGGVAAVTAIAPLVGAHKPRCLAMSGVCAGKRGAVELGDVIIANLLWDYDQGKQVGSRFLGRRISYLLPQDWAHRAESFSPAPGSNWLTQRPRTYEAQMDWMLERLLRREEPEIHPERKERCADLPVILAKLREKGWLFKREQRLTEKGRRYIQQRLKDHPDGLPEPRAFQIHVGPLATGTRVQRTPGIFERLAEQDYKVLGLEMEAAALAAFAHHQGIPYALVMKGVMDFADAAKNDHFKPFAARASAECLLEFLRENLTTVPAAPVFSEEALAAYKQAVMERPAIRHLELLGLAHVDPAADKAKLELLDFAVAPSLYLGVEHRGARELELQDLLRGEELESAQRLAFQRELERLQDARWEHSARSGNPRRSPRAFARALFLHKRLVIIGDPGAGKSILARLAFLACADGALGEQARRLLAEDAPLDLDALDMLEGLRGLLPLHLKLSEVGAVLEKERGLSLEDLIRGEIQKQKEGEALLGSLSLLFKAGRLFLLCDGLDEVPEALRERVVREVTGFLKRYQDIRLLVTTRPYDYRPKVPDLDHAHLAPLQYLQQRSLVARLHMLVEMRQRSEAAAVDRARQRTQALLDAVQRSHEWQTLTSNPLLLTLSALTRTDSKGFPRHRVIVFDNFVQTLLREWRSAVPRRDAELLLAAWASVASELIRQEKHQGAKEGYVLGLLADALEQHRAPAALTREDALRLALTRGLIREDGENIAFWHRTFAEFLAAYALTGADGREASSRLLGADWLPFPVLQLAAARLVHVLDAREEADSLALGLLARDAHGSGRLLRPGLRNVSWCLMDGVPFSSKLVERVWASWAELLARTPPSPAWMQFEPLTWKAPPRALPQPLVETFSRLPNRGPRDVQDGASLLVARLARVAPAAAREACTHWLRSNSFPHEAPRVHGALGLATLGEWDEVIIGALGQPRKMLDLGMDVIAQSVRDGGAALREQLLALARARVPGDEASLKQQSSSARASSPSLEEHRTVDLRFAAAGLLAIAGTWNESVVWVLQRTLSGQLSSSRLEEARTVLKLRAADKHVQALLLEWIRDGGSLGEHAREIVRETAPLIDNMPQQVLERVLEVEGSVQEKLEELLASVGAERRSLIDILWSRLEHSEERWRLLAARLLRKLAGRDPRLHDALRRGMMSPDTKSRAVWAHHSLGIEPGMSDEAMATLNDCARSADPAVRAAVYGANQRLLRFRLAAKWIERWLACATDATVPDAARMDAAQCVLYAPGALERLKPSFRALVESEDADVRLKAAFEIILRDTPDARTCSVAAEEAARMNDAEQLLFGVDSLKPFSWEVVTAVLRGLPEEAAPKESDRPFRAMSNWDRLLTSLNPTGPACIEALLQALARPGLPGQTAGYVLDVLAREHSAVRDAIGERLGESSARTRTPELWRLVMLGLSQEQTRSLAITASRSIDLRTLSQFQALGLARQLHSAQAPEDALRFWSSALEGPEPWLILEAAEDLSFHLSGQAGLWIQAAVALLLDSPSVSLRVEAARLALSCAVHEVKALQALTDCLELRGQLHAPGRGIHDVAGLVERRGFDDAASLELLEETAWRMVRIDVLALRTLYLHRPETGRRWLEQWLEDPELERFTFAVESLTIRGHSQKEAGAALLARVSSASDDQLESVLQLAHGKGVSPADILKRLLVRLDSEAGAYRVISGLGEWLAWHPTLWPELRQQPPARKEKLKHLLDTPLSVTRDALAFAVDIALAEEGPGADRCRRQIEGWCQPSERVQETFPQQVRGWLRDVLLHVTVPDTLAALWCFDQLAELTDLPSDRRIQTLTRALEWEIGPIDHEYSRHSLICIQARVALRLLKLNYPHQQLQPVLQRAVRELMTSLFFGNVLFASALLENWPDDATLRQSVVHTVLTEGIHINGEQLLALLEQARLSREERICIIYQCLGLEPPEPPPPYATAVSPHWRESAPTLFEALKQLGMETQCRTALLREFVSTSGTELPGQTRRELLRQAELAPSSASQLLVSAFTDRFQYGDDSGQTWLGRFASRRRTAKRNSSRLDLGWDPGSLSKRLDWFAELSQADEPEQVTRGLAELTGTPVEDLLFLHGRARQRVELTDAEWARLLEHLSLQPDEAKVSQLAKEWLTVGLWQALEPGWN